MTPAPITPPAAIPMYSRVRGVLFGGAIGDALGAPVEFLCAPDALARVLGAEPPVTLPRTTITDDTQMTLFTCEALVRHWVREQTVGTADLDSTTYHAYLRWYRTQGFDLPRNAPEFVNSGWLMTDESLWNQRAPGSTCLTSLRSGKFGTVLDPINDSMGCGGVMRTAPIGLLRPAAVAFDLGCTNAALTHGHRNGIIPSGALAMLVAHLVDGMEFDDALTQIIRRSADHSLGADTAAILMKARDLASNGFSVDEMTEALGEGWVGHEALAIAIACVAAFPSPTEAMWRAAWHPGDSDSTASIAGQILGAMHGLSAFPPEWFTDLELRGPILRLADTMLAIRDGHARVDALVGAFPGN